MKKSTNGIAWKVMETMTTKCSSARVMFATIVDQCGYEVKT